MADVLAPTSSLLHRPASYVERLDLNAVFSEPQPLEVELGAGDGSFLIEWTGLNRDRNFIGVERLMGRLVKIDKRGRRGGLTNLRGVRLEIAYFTEYLLPHGAVSAFHIYFPDPWPKVRHRKNRLIQAPFVKALRAALAADGVVYLRTDHPEYFKQMLEVFGANAHFAPVPTPERLLAVKTDFEREFNAQGIPTNWAAYRRVG